MPYCVHCSTEVLDEDRFCEGCGKPVVLPDKRQQQRAEAKSERRAELGEERAAGEDYYRRVGSKHPHIWPVTGAGSAIYLLCIGAAAFIGYVFGGSIGEIAADPILRVAVAAGFGFVIWIPLTVIRYTLNPEVRPHMNPEMMGSKGDFWVFLIGIPLIVLALVGWLMG